MSKEQIIYIDEDTSAYSFDDIEVVDVGPDSRTQTPSTRLTTRKLRQSRAIAANDSVRKG